MFRRSIPKADALFIILHSLSWVAVMVVWVVAWQAQPEPMGPPFRFAQGFITFIDLPASLLVQWASLSSAVYVHSAHGVDIGVAFTAIFAVMILFAGTLQWFLIGRLSRWMGGAFRRGVMVLNLGLGCWFLYGLLAWSKYWANW